MVAFLSPCILMIPIYLFFWVKGRKPQAKDETGVGSWQATQLSKPRLGSQAFSCCLVLPSGNGMFLGGGEIMYVAEPVVLFIVRPRAGIG